MWKRKIKRNETLTSLSLSSSSSSTQDVKCERDEQIMAFQSRQCTQCGCASSISANAHQKTIWLNCIEQTTKLITTKWKSFNKMWDEEKAKRKNSVWFGWATEMRTQSKWHSSMEREWAEKRDAVRRSTQSIVCSNARFVIVFIVFIVVVEWHLFTHAFATWLHFASVYANSPKENPLEKIHIQDEVVLLLPPSPFNLKRKNTEQYSRAHTFQTAGVGVCVCVFAVLTEPFRLQTIVWNNHEMGQTKNRTKK